jgi:malate dehydrogenase
MSVIAIIGAGALGGALAQKLAERSRAREIRLIDPEEAVARGKALDILQSGPVEGFSATVTAHASIHAAVGADAIAIADSVAGSEHAGETGLALIRQIQAAGGSGPIVFAGGTQRELMMRCVRELRLPPERLAGSAPAALTAAVRALCAVVIDTSAVDISLQVVGVPPRGAVVAWEEAAAGGEPLTSLMGAHEIGAVGARIPSLWPPGPYALASAGARVAEALCFGSRRRYSCFVDVGRGKIAAMPVELGRGGIKRVIQPTLSPLERTALENALEEG